MKSLSCAQLFATPWTVAYQPSPSMGFSRREYWSGLPWGGKKTIKNTNTRRLKNMLLNNQQIAEEIKKEIKICIETNENENMTTQNLYGIQ